MTTEPETPQSQLATLAYYFDDLQTFLDDARAYMSRFRPTSPEFERLLKPGLSEMLGLEPEPLYSSRQESLNRVWYAFYSQQQRYTQAVQRMEKLEMELRSDVMVLGENDAWHVRDGVDLDRRIARRCRARMEETGREEPV
ncbi:MAG: hypothetical protein LQ350_001827, partial [Teloschistes chrysophthalmus]